MDIYLKGGWVHLTCTLKTKKAHTTTVHKLLLEIFTCGSSVKVWIFIVFCILSLAFVFMQTKRNILTEVIAMWSHLESL